MAPLPNLLIIGAQKSGTRWLNHNLSQHPDIYFAHPELSFFNDSRRYAQGLDLYRSAFQGWEGQPIVGEGTPGYMCWRPNRYEVVDRIDAALPDVRLVAFLRDPVERTYSAFMHHMRHGRISVDTDLLDYIGSIDPRKDPLKLVSGSWYAASLEPFVERFDGRLLVLFSDSLTIDPAGLYRRVLAHVGADFSFVPRQVAKVRHGTPTPDGSRYADGQGGRRGLTVEERAAVYKQVAEDVFALEALTGRDLSAWRG